MNVIVLGGAGDMGSFAVEALAAWPGVAAITVADRDVEGARALADRLAGSAARVTPMQIDALEEESLVRAIAGHDVAASAVGPFHRFEVPCARAAVRAGVDYVSICDEWQAVDALRAEVDAMARDADVQVLTGMGASPGITNVAARALADGMDSVETVNVYCYEPLDAGGGFAVLQHVLYVMSGEVATWRDGRRTTVPACSEQVEMTMPGAGPVRLWNMGHPEPVTLPRALIGARDVRFWMGFGPGSAMLVAPARWGWFRTPRRMQAFAHVASWIERARRPARPGTGALRVDVAGTRAGQRVVDTIAGTGTMRHATGLAFAIGAVMVGDGRARRPGGGVVTPEECVPPTPFLEALRTGGIDARRTTTEPDA